MRETLRLIFGSNDVELDHPELLYPPKPLVAFRAGLGMYVVGNVAIYYCPWCGAELPRVSPEDPRRRGVREFKVER